MLIAFELFVAWPLPRRGFMTLRAAAKDLGTTPAYFSGQRQPAVPRSRLTPRHAAPPHCEPQREAAMMLAAARSSFERDDTFMPGRRRLF